MVFQTKHYVSDKQIGIAPAMVDARRVMLLVRRWSSEEVIDEEESWGTWLVYLVHIDARVRAQVRMLCRQTAWQNSHFKL